MLIEHLRKTFIKERLNQKQKDTVVDKRVGQGCVISSTLFNILVEQLSDVPNRKRFEEH